MTRRDKNTIQYLTTNTCTGNIKQVECTVTMVMVIIQYILPLVLLLVVSDLVMIVGILQTTRQ